MQAQLLAASLLTLAALLGPDGATAQHPLAPVLLQAPPPQSPAPPSSGGLVAVPGSAALLREPGRVDQVVLPYENYQPEAGQQPGDYKNSYVIDHKRYVEPYSSRCFTSTLLEDPDAVEPNFVIIRPRSEVRVNATAPLEALLAARYEPQKPSTLIVHGFTQSYPSTDWLRKVRALFEVHALIERQNLIIMDWGAGSHGSYAQVAARASGMGSFLANFLMKMFELGADRRQVHIIGHSLGAHLAGFAGKRLRPPVGRISALDPAGPCFGKLFSNSAHDRLAPEDALQVDVLHYDDDFLGLSAQLGHWDVYVNGGSSQPGAVDNLNSMLQALVTMVFRRNRILSESHTRSTEVATCQLGRTGCQEIAYECRDWPAFLSGECGHCDINNSQCFNIGFHFQYTNAHFAPPRAPPPTPKRLYLATGSNELYCLNHYQILVHFEPAPDLSAQAKRNKWRLQLEMSTGAIESPKGALSVNVSIDHQMAPSVFSFLWLSELQPPTRFRRAQLQVRQSDKSIVPLRVPRAPLAPPPASQYKKRPYAQAHRVLSVEINFMSHEHPQARQALSSRLCPLALGAPPTDSNSIQDDTGESTFDLLLLEECR